MSKCNPPFNNPTFKSPKMQFMIDAALEKESKLMDKVFTQKSNDEPIDNFQEVSALFVTDYKGKRHDVPTKKVVLYHGTPASELEGGAFDIKRSGNQGSDWLQGTHATPDINVAKGYFEEGGSVFRVGYKIDKMWNLRGDNTISAAMLRDYTAIMKKDESYSGEAANKVQDFVRDGSLKHLNRGQQRDFLLKHGYNLVLDGSQRTVMLNPAEAGTSPVKITESEIGAAEVRRKKSAKYLAAYQNLDRNRRSSQNKREATDKEYSDNSFNRYSDQMMASHKKMQARIAEIRARTP